MKTNQLRTFLWKMIFFFCSHWHASYFSWVAGRKLEFKKLLSPSLTFQCKIHQNHYHCNLFSVPLMASLHDDGEVGFEEGKLLLPSNVLDEACDSNNNKVNTNSTLVSLLSFITLFPSTPLSLPVSIPNKHLGRFIIIWDSFLSTFLGFFIEPI